MKDEILYQTEKKYLTIKKCKDLEFFYVEKLGLDSVSVVLLDPILKKIGLLNEGKLSITEREDSDLSFKVSSVNGSFFEYIDIEKYKKIDFNKQLQVAKYISEKKVIEKTGYSEHKLEFVNRTIFNYNSNEFVWLFVAIVNKNSIINKNIKKIQDDVYTTIWFNYEDIPILEDGKIKATIYEYFLLNRILKY